MQLTARTILVAAALVTCLGLGTADSPKGKASPKPQVRRKVIRPVVTTIQVGPLEVKGHVTRIQSFGTSFNVLIELDGTQEIVGAISTNANMLTVFNTAMQSGFSVDVSGPQYAHLDAQQKRDLAPYGGEIWNGRVIQATVVTVTK